MVPKMVYEEKRTMRADRIYWAGHIPFVFGPSFDEQYAPAMPSFRDLFDYGDISGLEKNWGEISGKYCGVFLHQGRNCLRVISKNGINNLQQNPQILFLHQQMNGGDMNGEDI